jgi:copper resistance protein D
VNDDGLLNLWFVAARAVHIGACLLLFGVAVFDRFIAIGPARKQWQSIARWLNLPSLAAALLSGSAWLFLVAINMSGLPPRQAMQLEVLHLVWSQTRFGFVWQVRLVLCLLTAITILVRRLRRTTLIFSGLMAASLAFSGHGQAGPGASWHLLADGLHLLVAGCWPMGLLPFSLLCWRLRHSPADSADSLAAITARFSIMSLCSVALLTGTGLANSYVLLGPVSNLFRTAYGRVLTTKIAVFVLMIGLGAVNLLVLKPRLATRSPTTAARLQWTVGGELALAALVIVLVAILGLLPPGAMPMR